MPLQLKSTTWLNPFTGVPEIVNVALFPAVTVVPEGVPAKE